MALRSEAASALGIAEPVAWDSVDDASVVLLAFHDGVPLATMALTLFLSPASAQERFLDGNPVPARVDRWPVGALRRAATTGAARGRNLNAALRWVSLSMLMQTPARYVIGSVQATDATHAYFTELGYEIFAEPLGWRSGHRATSTIVLDLHSAGARAIRMLEDVRVPRVLVSRDCSVTHLRGL